MNPVKLVWLLAAVWLATATGAARAAFVCTGTCSYAGSVVLAETDNVHALPGSTIADVTGAPVYAPLEGVVLSMEGDFVPTTSSVLTVQMPEPVVDSLWIVSDDDESADDFVADERFELYVSNDGIAWEDLGTFYNNNDAIDLSAYVSSFGAVNYVRTQALGVDILCQLNPGSCTTPVYDNAMEILAISGIPSTAAVPLPAALWLFGPGLAGLIALARRRPPGTPAG
ncbi:MAG: VPLPA-CTERM sorting domain-containing protein [Gammaproteobacteria bacterium]|jgi:hypothetical protein